jgi:hypothetical protein
MSLMGSSLKRSYRFGVAVTFVVVLSVLLSAIGFRYLEIVMAPAMKKERTRKTQSQYSELTGFKFDPIPEDEEEISRFVSSISIYKSGVDEVDEVEVRKVVVRLLSGYHIGGFEKFMEFRYPVPPEWSGDVHALIEKHLSLPRTNSIRASLEPENARFLERELWPSESLKGYSVIDLIRARCARQSLGTMFTNAWVGVSRTNALIEIVGSEKVIRQSFEKIRSRFEYLGSTEFPPARSFRVRNQESESNDSETIWMGLRAPILRGNNDGPIVCCVAFYYSKTHSQWIPHRIMVVSLIKESEIDIDF